MHQLAWNLAELLSISDLRQQASIKNLTLGLVDGLDSNSYGC